MKIEITEKKENKLLGRVEVKGKLVFEGATPSNAVLRDTLAAELKADKELVVVKQIYSKFSYQEAEFLAFVYTKKELLEKMEVTTKYMKKKAEEAGKKAEEEKAAAAEKKEEEKPAEEAPKEEAPAEEETPVEEKKEEAKE